MATKEKKQSLHDTQTSAAAESIRAVLNDSTFRGGNTQRDMDALRDKLEGIAKGLDEQGKSPEEIEEMHEEAGEPDPNKTAAELVRETFKADSEDPKQSDKKSVSSPGQPVDNKVDLGKPLVPSQASTHDRDKVETTAKKAADTIEKTATAPKK